ncbi:MAG: AzlC family ABC transporter permease [Pseudomonadota bacterium]
MRNIASLPAIVLMSAFIGFGGLAREAGLPLEQLVFLVPVIWALPSHLILLAGIVGGAPLLVIAPAVALAAIRMMPMTMALMPAIRAPKSKQWHLLLASNLVAITAWVHTLEKASDIPQRGRLPYFVGFASTMAIATTCVAALVHQLAPALPPLAMACLYFLTPLYFATSIWNTARVKAEHAALIFGFVLGPIAWLIAPQAAILLAGSLGGVLAYAVHRMTRKLGKNTPPAQNGEATEQGRASS